MPDCHKNVALCVLEPVAQWDHREDNRGGLDKSPPWQRARFNITGTISSDNQRDEGYAYESESRTQNFLQR